MSTPTNTKSEFRKSNSSTSCFSDDTELLDVPKPVAAHSKKEKYKATKYLELQISDSRNMEGVNNGAITPPVGTMIRKERPRRFHQKCKSPIGRRNKSPSVSEKTFDSTSCTSKWSSSEEELSGYNDHSASYTKSTSGSHNTGSGSEKRHRRKLTAQSSLNDDEEEDGSTCGDEDFHWVKTEPPSEQRTVSPSSSQFTKDSSISTNGMPPRPPGSLDRRRHNPKNRHDRDFKSRSSHSLKEKQRENHQNSHFHHASNDYLQHFGGSQFMLHEHPSMPCLANGMMGWSSRENLLHQKQQSDMYHSTQDLMQCCNRYPFLTPAAAAMYCHCNYPFNSTSTLTLPHMMCPTNLCGQQQGKV